MAPATLTHSKLFISLSFILLPFFICNLGLILGGESSDFGWISPLLWVVILGENLMLLLLHWHLLLLFLQFEFDYLYRFDDFFFFFWEEGLMNLGPRFIINLMICIDLLLDSREDRGERKQRKWENRMRDEKEK